VEDAIVFPYRCGTIDNNMIANCCTGGYPHMRPYGRVGANLDAAVQFG
jgi:hypothetical protein